MSGGDVNWLTVAEMDHERSKNCAPHDGACLLVTCSAAKDSIASCAGEQPLAVLTFITSSSLICWLWMRHLNRNPHPHWRLRDYCAQMTLLAHSSLAPAQRCTPDGRYVQAERRLEVGAW